MPGDLRQAPLTRRRAEEALALQRRVLAAKADHQLEEAQQLALGLAEIPREPADRVILAVDVIVPALCLADLIAAPQHRHTLREQQDRGKVLDLAQPQRLDRR